MRITDVGGSGVAGSPSFDYRLSDGVFGGWKPMVAGGGDTWSFDIPDLGWPAKAGKSLEYKVQATDSVQPLLRCVKGQLETGAVAR